MSLPRWIALRVIGGTLAALTLLAGLVGLATTVEHGRSGLGAALSAGLSVVPITLVWLAPLCCGVGAALAAARAAASGEQLALQVSGVGPRRTGWVPALVGTSLGLCTLWASESLVPSTVAPVPQSAWVWLDGGAYRASDGASLRLDGGRLESAERTSAPSTAALQRARHLARPRTAPTSVLIGADSGPARVALHVRVARVLACGALCVLGWVPLVRRGSYQVAAVLTLGLLAQATGAVAELLAAQGQLGVVAGAWGVPILLCVAAVLISARR
jgi:lipopolysaccharide export LptBFGC system permease protein LptF